MAKKITGEIRLQLPAGAANPAPPVGPALGAKGVNIAGFCKEFNAKTQDKAGTILPVVISVYSDRSFTFITKSPPAPVLLKRQLDWQKERQRLEKSKWGLLPAPRSMKSSKQNLRISTPMTKRLQLV